MKRTMLIARLATGALSGAVIGVMASYWSFWWFLAVLVVIPANILLWDQLMYGRDRQLPDESELKRLF